MCVCQTLSVCVCCTDVNRDAELKHVEAKNADLIGIICAVIVSALLLLILILDLDSIKQSLQLMHDNLISGRS